MKRQEREYDPFPELLKFKSLYSSKNRFMHHLGVGFFLIKFLSFRIGVRNSTENDVL